MKSHHGNRKHTASELLIVLGLLCTAVFALICLVAVPRANCWYVEDAMKVRLLAERENISAIVRVTRNMISPSVIEATTRSGTAERICLDTDAFFNYSFATCN